MLLGDKQLADSRTDGTSLSWEIYNLGNEWTWGQPHPLLECQKKEKCQSILCLLQTAKPFFSQVRHCESHYWLSSAAEQILFIFDSDLRSPKLQLGDASLNAACYWMQRTVYYMGFVVEWFIGMQLAALGFGKRLPGFASLYVSLVLTVYSPGQPPLFACNFLAPPLCLLKFFQFLSLFLHLQFPFFLSMSKFSSYYQYITSKPFSNLWIPSSPLLYLTQKLNGGCRLGEYLFHRVLLDFSLSFSGCQARWAAMSLTLWPLWLLWQT